MNLFNYLSIYQNVRFSEKKNRKFFWGCACHLDICEFLWLLKIYHGFFNVLCIIRNTCIMPTRCASHLVNSLHDYFAIVLAWHDVYTSYLSFHRNIKGCTEKRYVIMLIVSETMLSFISWIMCIFIWFNLDSPYRDKISSIILKLQEDQTIQKFYNTWWKEKNKDGECIDSTKKQTNALTIKNVGGIFVVLIAGTMAGVVVAFFEFLWKARKNAKEDKVGILNILSTFPFLIEFLMLYFF